MTKESINLVRNKKTNFEKFIGWSLTIGRLIIIITETIALSAFLYRFSLDQQLIDLHDKIKKDQTIVSLLSGNEIKYRNLQQRLSLANKLTALAKNDLENFKNVIAAAPSDLNLINLAYSKERISVEAEIQTVAPLSTFVKNLKEKKKIVKSVSIEKIEDRTSTSKISFSLTAHLTGN